MGQLRVVILAVVSSVVWTSSSAQDVTIPERVAASGGGEALTFVTNPDRKPIPLSRLAAAADLIVQGKLVRQESRLSDDKRKIYTDYKVVPAVVVADRVPAVILKAPGASPPMTVTIPGGELMIHGTQVRYEDASQLTWPEGASFLMFLRRKGELNKFELCGGIAGLFQIDSTQRVKSLLDHPHNNKEVADLSLDQVTQRARDAFVKR